MKTYRFAVPSLIVALGVTGCASTEPFLKPGGELVEIKLTDGNKRLGELLTLEDTMLTILIHPAPEQGVSKPVAFSTISYENIRSMQFTAFNGHVWVLPWVLCQVVPTLVFTIEAASLNVGEAGIIFVFPTLLTGFFMEISTPPDEIYEPPFTPNSVKIMKRYCRYPQGLTEEQWQAFKKVYVKTAHLAE